LVLRFFLVLISLFFLLSCTDSAEKDISSTTKEQSEGKSLFDKNCAICHGKKGDAQIGGAKNLTMSTISVEETKQIISKGKGSMAGYGSFLNESQIDLLVVYIATLKKQDEATK
jgi:mono/diheme cytochrome c family protein